MNHAGPKTAQPTGGTMCAVVPALVPALVLVLALTVGWLPTLHAETVDSVPNPRLRDGSWVSDTAGMLKPQTGQQLSPPGRATRA